MVAHQSYHICVYDNLDETAVARDEDEDDGVGWFVAVPALMKPAPLNINVPIPGIPCDKKKLA